MYQEARWADGTQTAIKIPISSSSTWSPRSPLRRFCDFTKSKQFPLTIPILEMATYDRRTWRPCIRESVPPSIVNVIPAGTDSHNLHRRPSWLRFREAGIRFLLFCCAGVSVITTLAIVFILFNEAIWSFTGWIDSRLSGKADVVKPVLQAENAAEDDADPREVKTDLAFFQVVSPRQFFGDTQWAPTMIPQRFGVWPLICGTLMISGIASVIGLPVGVLAAIYLSEYASVKVRSIVKPILEFLAGLPTVVLGYFALQFLTPILLKPILETWLGFDVESSNALAAGIVVAIMMIPIVCSLSEDALRAVPRSLREAGYALGGTKFDVSVKVVLPGAISGIIAAILLAVSRAIGETMAVTIAAGQSPKLTGNPLRSVQTMTSFMVNISQGDASAGTIAYKSLYAVGLCLFCMTLLMNVVSQRVTRRFREVYQ